MRKLVGITIALAAVMIGPASAQGRIEGAAQSEGLSLTTDPQVQVYRFSGVRDNGGAASVGVATSFHCTNFSGATETLRIQIRAFNGTVIKDSTLNIPHNNNRTISTHFTNAYFEDLSLETGTIDQGSARIWATSTMIVCTASTIDAAAIVPYGVDLHGIRFNPIPGTEY
jgi:hypothetical protein